MIRTDPTKTPATRRFYRKKAQATIAVFRRQTGLDWARDPKFFLGFMRERAKGLRKASWRLERAALHHYFVISSAIEMARNIKEISTSACFSAGLKDANAPSRTSASKQRHLSESDYRAVRAWIMARKDQFGCADLAVALLLAARRTGLRPSEWRTARLEQTDGKQALVVENAKNTNRRAHGLTRTIYIDQLTSDDRHCLDVVVGKFTKLGGDTREFARLIKNVCRTIDRATQSLWPHRRRRPTLYSARHQFSADAKKAGLTLAQIAALMGHATDETASAHYGRKRSGTSGFCVSPRSAEVQRIRCIYKRHPRAKVIAARIHNFGPGL